MERIYRDAVHNIIRLNTGTAEGALSSGTWDSAEFQRLRRIGSLGWRILRIMRPSNSRFAHSLGAFHLAYAHAGKAAINYEIAEEDQTAVRVACTTPRHWAMGRSRMSSNRS
jgi:HD superfamily phosphohydrolase